MMRERERDASVFLIKRETMRRIENKKDKCRDWLSYKQTGSRRR